MDLKKIVIFVLIVAAVIEGGYYWYNKKPPNASSPTTSATPPPATAPVEKISYTIGVILPLTGNQAIYGQGIKEGLDLSAKGVNDTTRFGIHINLVYEDTRSEAKNAPTAARKLIDSDHAIALITGLSPTSLAVAPLAEEKKIVLFTMASLATQLNTAGAFVFKNDDDVAKIGILLAETALNKGFKTASILFAHYNDSTVDAKDAFIKKYKTQGGTIASTEGFSDTTADFKTILTKLIAPQPATVVILGLQRDCALAVKQIRELKYTNQLFGFSCMEDPQVIQTAGAATEGIIFANFNPPLPPNFVQKVKDAYGHEPLRWTVEAFDGLKLLAIAIAHTTPADGAKSLITSDMLRETLTTVKSIGGESGTVTFDKEGNAQRALFLKTIKNGKVEIAK